MCNSSGDVVRKFFRGCNLMAGSEGIDVPWDLGSHLCHRYEICPEGGGYGKALKSGAQDAVVQ